ncbi:MAG: hypothetical protein Q9165_005980 [Trypethelium subeluteriae]
MKTPNLSKSLGLVTAFAAATNDLNVVQAQLSNSSHPSSALLFNYVGSSYPNRGPAIPLPVNATEQISQSGFSPPNGPGYLGGTWTWTTAIYDFFHYDEPFFPDWINQQTWLRTQPEQNLLSPTLQYVGFLDLPVTTIKAGQIDDGSYNSILSQSCLNELQSSFQDEVLRYQNQSDQLGICNSKVSPRILACHENARMQLVTVML